MAKRIPQPAHKTEPVAEAPGDLELVRSFISLHDHEVGRDESLRPSAQGVLWWLTDRGLLEAGAEASDEDLEWALEVQDSLRARVLENMGNPPDPVATEILDRAAARARVNVHFAGSGSLSADAPGVAGAIGRLLSITFLSELDGTWRSLRECASPSCRDVFYDRSRNGSAKWCSMRSCGNRAKVRAYRARRRADPA